MNNKEEQVVSEILFNQVSQLAHIAGGLAVVFGSVVLFGTPMRAVEWWAFGVVAALAAVKEFWFDQRYETDVVRGSNLEDWSFYLLGAGIAAVLSTIARLV